MTGLTSGPVDFILVTSVGLVGSTTGTGKAAMLTAAQARTLVSVYSTAEVDTLLAAKANSATTLAGYGITDAVSLGGVQTLTGAKSYNANVNWNNTTGTTYAQWNASTRVFYAGGDAFAVLTTDGTTRLYSGGKLLWNSAPQASSGIPDIGLARNAAGILEVNSGTAADFRDLKARTLMAYSTIEIDALSSTSTAREQGQFVGSWVSSTDASRKAQVEEKVYDTAARTVARSFANGTNGYKALKVLATAPADADLAVSEVVFYTDGSGNLAIKLKDSGGTVRTGTVTLA